MKDNPEEQLAEIARNDAIAEAGQEDETILPGDAIEQDEPAIDETSVDVNPWKAGGFENEKEFSEFVSDMRSYKEKADRIEGEFDAYKAGAYQKSYETPAAPNDSRFSKYPFVGHDAKSYQTDEAAQDTTNEYAIEFFRSPREATLDLIADDVEAYVNARISEAFTQRDTNATVDSRRDYLVANESKVNALRENFPGASDKQILIMMDTLMPESRENPDAAREKDSLGINTETGTAPRTGPKNPISDYDSDDDEQNKFLNKISRMVS